MQNPYRIKNSTFLVNWIMGSLFVWILGGVFAVGIGIVAFFIALMFANALDYWAAGIAELMIFGAVGLALGYAVGLIQQWLVRKKLLWELEGWTKVSAAGGFVGGVVVSLSALAFYQWDDVTPQIWYGYGDILTVSSDYLPMTVFGAVLGLAQWFVLRHYVRAAWLWAFANMVGGLLFSSLFMRYYDATLFDWLLAATAQGAVTGATMLWLFLKNVHPENIATENQQAQSVWDRAI